MPTDPTRPLVFLDLETTDLDPQKGHILELGILIANAQTLEETHARSWVIYLPDPILDNQSPWSQEQHGKSGLTEESRRSECLFSCDSAQEALAWLGDLGLEPGKHPMVGCSIHFDRAWLKVHMPSLERWFYYGNTDISSIARFVQFVRPDYSWEGTEAHRVDPDNRDALAELRYMVSLFQPITVGS